MTVKRDDSLLGRVGPAAVAGKLTNGSTERRWIARLRMRFQMRREGGVDSTTRIPSESTLGSRQVSTALMRSPGSSSIRCHLE